MFSIYSINAHVPTVKGDITMNEIVPTLKALGLHSGGKSTKELKHRQNMMPQKKGLHPTQVLHVYTYLLFGQGSGGGGQGHLKGP